MRTVLDADPGLAVVACAGDGREAVDLALRHRPDVALLDLSMPVMGGLAALAELRRVAPEVRVVVLTAFGEEENVARALEGGAAGFVLKNCAPDELRRAVRAAHRGDAFLSPSVTRLVLGWAVPRHQAAPNPRLARLARLTERERQVLDAVADGLSNAEAARRLGSTEASVKTYVSRVLAKLDCTNRVQAALLAREAAGYRG
ncbi:response regulator [Mangrovactinospora gilvigrisea]|uniref:response regulator n=1 Tax=Mangrovactinospora gilvigrisea TaxID=1428644 RepID=UPI001FE8B7BF|nr:response regulator transcription factor [Mangrovactinospora gilvigrisea]